MSAALLLPCLWAAQAAPQSIPDGQFGPYETAIHHIHKRLPPVSAAIAAAQPTQLGQPAQPAPLDPPDPLVSYAFYRRHTESLLKRYLQASMMIGRSPNLLGDSVDRGWCSSRPVRTFEDALIFVLDVERCLKRLSQADLQILSRVVVQQNTHAETAALLGISTRTVYTRLPQAIDRLTEYLVKYDLLVVPD